MSKADIAAIPRISGNIDFSETLVDEIYSYSATPQRRSVKSLHAGSPAISVGNHLYSVAEVFDS